MYSITSFGKTLKFISSFVGKYDRLKTLYPIIEVRSWGDNFCIVYPFEPSSKYKGGHLEDIFIFLKECKDVGIVYRNIHPDNFVLTKVGLKLIHSEFIGRNPKHLDLYPPKIVMVFEKMERDKK